ncbi:MAG: glycosyltransferase, partial [Myxococcota bacterium]
GPRNTGDSGRSGNNYGHLSPSAPLALKRFPTVTVVVPVYNRKEALGRTLAGLAHQNYPDERYEVVVADDGSADAPESLAELFSAHLNLRFLRQEDQGYRLSAARNLGIRSSDSELVVSLDCDMIPLPGLLRAYARWFLEEPSLLVVGGRRFVQADQVSAAELLGSPSLLDSFPADPGHSEATGKWQSGRDWRGWVRTLSSDLRFHPHPYSVASGGNVAFRRQDAIDAGLYDEGFQHWGGEDADFAHRMVGRGAYVVWEEGATALHQAHPPSVPRQEHLRTTLSQMGARIPYYRRHCREEIVRPEVSVYMPARNVERFVESAVQSLLDQDFQDFELCVVNDGSTDRTGEILDRLAAEDPRIRVTHAPERQGIPVTAQQAVSLCRGEYIAQLDSDDELMPGALWSLLKRLRADPSASLAYSGYLRIDGSGEVIGENLGEPFSWKRALQGNIVTHLRMFRRSVFWRTPGFDPTLAVAEDYALALELASRGRVIHVPKTLYRYRRHGTNITASGPSSDHHLRVARSWIARLDPSLRIESTEHGFQLFDAQGQPVQRSTWERVLGRIRVLASGLAE